MGRYDADGCDTCGGGECSSCGQNKPEPTGQPWSWCDPTCREDCDHCEVALAETTPPHSWEF
jgi:hypothetical protein